MIKLEFIPFKTILLTAIIVLLGIYSVIGQCVPLARKYATVQQGYTAPITSINNPSLAADGNPETFSTINVPVGALNLLNATQYLEITSGTNFIPANTPVTIKISLPTSVLGLLDNVVVQPIKNLRFPHLGLRYIADDVGVSYSGASLLNLINGSGELEFTIVPQLPYQGVSISIGSIAGVAVSAKIYDAYITQNGPLNGACNTNIDVLSGIRAGTVIGGIANATGQVIDPRKAIDDDLLSYAELKLGAQVASEVFQTTVFKTPSQPGDAVQMIIQKPGGGFLDLNLLNGFTIRMYNGQTQAGTAFSASSSLSLLLLPGSTAGNEKFLLTIPVPKSAGAFDRVELKIGGLLTAGLTPGIRIYDVKRIVLPKTAINGSSASSINLCLGNTAALSISELQDCTTYKWFNTPTGGTMLHSGNGAYTPTVSSLVIGQNIFYLEATRTNCTDIINRVPVTIYISPLPTASIIGTASVCQSAPNPSVIFTGSNGTGPYTFTYNINAGANQTISTTTGNSIALLVPNTIPGEYKYLLVNVKDNGGNQCAQAQSSLATVNITAKPQPPSLTINANN